MKMPAMQPERPRDFSSLSARNVLEAVGVGVALIFHSLYPLMSPSRLVYYHSSTAMHSVLLACVFDLLLGAAFYLLVRLALLRLGWWAGGRLVLASLLPWMLFVLDPSLLLSLWTHLHGLLLRGGVGPSNYVAAALSIHARMVFLALWIVLLLGLMRFAPVIYRGVMQAGAIGLAGLAIFAFLATYSVARAWAWHPEMGTVMPMHVRSAGERHPRVVWVLLDELSYEQVFGRRAPELALPNFDALAAESTVFTQARPVGYWTEMVIPSLLLGRRIDSLRASHADTMLVGDGHGGSKPYPTSETVTAEAQRLGWNVGIAGWYNPYCSMLSGTFQKCFWTDRENPSGPMLTAATVWQNMVAGLTDQINFGHRDLGVELARSEDELLFSNAASLLGDESMDFVFLHFPLPHPPGVWDRKKGDWAGGDDPGYVGSYEDNLALADQELGRILGQLRQSQRWPETTVLVQGDHAWRVELWHDNPTWTAEDERDSRGGKFDDRPALMVHSPGQTEGNRVDAPTSLMEAHTMLQQAVRTGRPLGEQAQN